MKPIKILSVVALVAAIAGCNKQDIPTYNDLSSDRYIHFSTKSADTTEVTFFDYPNATVINYPVILVATGWSEQDLEYKVSIVPEETTADASDYTLPEKSIFRSKRGVDTLFVQLHYSKKLDDQKVKLTLKLEPNENFVLGQSSNLQYSLVFHSNIAQPAWWSAASSYYLGTYSNAKYRAFMPFIEDLKSMSDQLLKQGEWAGSTAVVYSLVNLYSRRFKKYLEDMAAAGTPILEDNGSRMTVNVK